MFKKGRGVIQSMRWSRSNDGVESTLTMMRPYLRVTSVQAKLTLDYLQDKITGDGFIKAVNAEVQAGRWGGKIYTVDSLSNGQKVVRKYGTCCLLMLAKHSGKWQQHQTGIAVLGSMPLREMLQEELKLGRSYALDS